MTYINLEPSDERSYSSKISRPNGVAEYRLPKVSRRRFDEKLCVWVKDLPPLRAQNRGPRAKSALPIGDGSGVFWEVYCVEQNQKLWKLENASVFIASQQAEDLCQLAGYNTRDWGIREFRE